MLFAPIQKFSQGKNSLLVSPLLLILSVALLVTQFALPRRFAFLPLLIAACHLPNVTVIDVGFSFFPARLLILAGLIRAARTNTRPRSLRSPLDVLMLCWACWMVLSTVGHHPQDHNPLTLRLGWACDLFGGYLYARAYLRDQEDFLRFCKCLALVVVPLALFMFIEQLTGRNCYDAVGAWDPEVRLGRVRAQGPFTHSILAGTVAATCLPLIVPLLRRNLWRGVTGCVACGAIVLFCRSSGPILTLFVALAAMALWRWRSYTPWMRRGFLVAIIALQLVMNNPVWYLMGRIDLAGGSTGYHRAQLITQALKSLDEWWLVGTDYTRHWMPYGIGWSKTQVDITNYYLKMGVLGGLPLMLCFIAVLVKSFQLLGRRMSAMRKERNPAEFMLWCAGATLFAHSVTFISVSYFDQSFVFLFFVIGAVPGLVAERKNQPIKVTANSVKHDPDAAPLPGVNDHPQPA